MKTSSCKAKGRNWQKKIVEDILIFFPDLQPDDCLWRSMGAQGEDIMLSPKARKALPLSIEAKCVEKLNFWEAFEQAKLNAKKLFIPVVFAKRNRTEPLAVLAYTDFLWIMSQLNEARQKDKADTENC